MEPMETTEAMETEAKPEATPRVCLVSCVRDAAHILPRWIEYHRAVGVTHFYLAHHRPAQDPPDGTAEILAHLTLTDPAVCVEERREETFLEPKWVTELARRALRERGAADALLLVHDTDEFLDGNGESFREAVADVFAALHGRPTRSSGLRASVAGASRALQCVTPLCDMVPPTLGENCDWRQCTLHAPEPVRWGKAAFALSGASRDLVCVANHPAGYLHTLRTEPPTELCTPKTLPTRLWPLPRETFPFRGAHFYFLGPEALARKARLLGPGTGFEGYLYMRFRGDPPHRPSVPEEHAAFAALVREDPEQLRRAYAQPLRWALAQATDLVGVAQLPDHVARHFFGETAPPAQHAAQLQAELAAVPAARLALDNVPWTRLRQPRPPGAPVAAATLALFHKDAYFLPLGEHCFMWFLLKDMGLRGATGVFDYVDGIRPSSVLSCLQDFRGPEPLRRYFPERLGVSWRNGFGMGFSTLLTRHSKPEDVARVRATFARRAARLRSELRELRRGAPVLLLHASYADAAHQAPVADLQALVREVRQHWCPQACTVRLLSFRPRDSFETLAPPTEALPRVRACADDDTGEDGVVLVPVELPPHPPLGETYNAWADRMPAFRSGLSVACGYWPCLDGDAQSRFRWSGIASRQRLAQLKDPATPFRHT